MRNRTCKFIVTKQLSTSQVPENDFYSILSKIINCYNMFESYNKIISKVINLSLKLPGAAELKISHEEKLSGYRYK
jgi:hypothetical protein